MRGHAYFNLANEDVQTGRAAITVEPSGKPLHDYVPLYMGFKTPMVAYNQEYNEQIVFIRYSLDLFTNWGVVVADGNARSSNTKFKLFQHVDDLEFLDAAAIRTVKYAHDPELKRKKQAEILVPDRLPISQVLDFICFSLDARNQILAMMRQYGINKPVKVNTGWYFTQR